MNPLMTEKIRVRIYGKEYEMDAGGLTPLEANQLASYVDQKMKEIAEKLRIVDTQKIAVLAALNITFELTMQRDADQGLPAEDQNKIKGMISALEKALSSSAHSTDVSDQKNFHLRSGSSPSRGAGS